MPLRKYLSTAVQGKSEEGQPSQVSVREDIRNKAISFKNIKIMVN